MFKPAVQIIMTFLGVVLINHVDNICEVLICKRNKALLFFFQLFLERFGAFVFQNKLICLLFSIRQEVVPF